MHSIKLGWLQNERNWMILKIARLKPSNNGYNLVHQLMYYTVHSLISGMSTRDVGSN
jgi:hypothetical protein